MSESPFVAGGPTPGPIVLSEHDPQWGTDAATLAERVRAALGGLLLDVQHVGSTSVPGLPAKPVVDLVATVRDPSDEATYVPALGAAGFTLTVREPDWYEHRCLRLDQPAANLHVFGPGCTETRVMIAFRDWLRVDAADRARYAEAKRAAADATNAEGGHVMDYNARKGPVLLEIREHALAHALQ